MDTQRLEIELLELCDVWSEGLTSKEHLEAMVRATARVFIFQALSRDELMRRAYGEEPAADLKVRIAEIVARELEFVRKHAEFEVCDTLEDAVGPTN